MTDAVNPALSAVVEARIQSRWLGLTQAEFGALQTNYFMLQARVEAHIAQRVEDLQLIEGLKQRALTAEDNNRILIEQLQSAQKEIAALQATKKPRLKRST